MYDLAIIGAGPGGYVAAERAGAKGLSVVLFEKSELGGVCLNEGCIPTKTLLYSAKTYDAAKNAKKYGVSTENVGIDFSAMMKRKQKVVKKLVGGVGSKMKAHKVDVVKGAATILGKKDGFVQISCADSNYEAKNLLICTGSEAIVPPIEGVNGVSETLLTNREILDLKEQPDTLVIIGGGVIGTEFACFFNVIGTKVIVIEMMDEILTGMEKDQCKMFRELYTKKGIEFHLQSKVTKIDGNKVFFEKDGKTHEVVGDKILMSVGRKAVVDGYGLENLGVDYTPRGIKVDNQLRTNIPNVFAAGDVTGFSLLAHTASREGEVVVNNIAGEKDVMRYNAIPGVVYTNPELAGVGLTEEAAKKKGIEYKVVSLPMAYAGRFIAENEGGEGVCKVLVGAKYGEVLGVHMLGNPSSEMIYGACMAIEMEMTLKEMKEVVFPHPTVSEIFKESVFAI